MRIDWSEPALAGLEAIYDFIARDSSHLRSPIRATTSRKQSLRPRSGSD